jgi:CubicO group peptidase (beta-lactamase class C family)
MKANDVLTVVNQKRTGLPAPISRRSLLVWGMPLLGSIALQATRSLASPVSPQRAPSTGGDKLEHIFELPSSSWNSWIKALETRIPSLMQQTSVPGLSIVLIRDAKIYWRGGFGVRDAETRQPVDNDTVFEAASMSKSVFAYVVMKLTEQGVINLDVPLTKYTDTRYIPDDPRLDLITARHVLMHSTGFPNWRSKGNPMAINFTPGQRFSYSGEGYSYLQQVITHLTGHVDRNRCGTYESDVQFCATDIADYMQRRLLRPFHMNSSAYLWSEQLAKNVARPHGEHGEPLSYPKTTAVDASRYASSGGLKTTPSDFAKFLIEVVQPRPADEFHLSKKSRDEMIRAQIPVGNFDGYSVFWGLGWRIVRMAQHELIGHGGANPGFQCFAEVSPWSRSGFVIMTNADSGVNLLKLLTATAIGN